MNATVIDEVTDSTAQVVKPVSAGFSTRASDKPVKAVEFHVEPLLETLGLAPAHAGFVTINARPLADQIPLAANEPLDFNSQTISLHTALCDAWGQTEIDQKAFERVKHFTILQAATAETSLIVADHVSQDEMRVGTRADGVQAVLGNTDITAAQALSRAQMAMTSARFRTEGVDEVHGTDKDKALLMLAAAEVGLTIVNVPEISPEVMAEAQAEWNTLKAAPSAPVQETISALPQTKDPVTIKPLNVIEGMEVTEFSSNDIPVLTDVISAEELVAAESLRQRAAAVASAHGHDVNYISPEARIILATQNISDETYLMLRKQVETGASSLVRANGTVSRTGLSQIFHQQTYDGATVEAALKSLLADRVVDAYEAGTYKVRTHQAALTLA